MEFKVGDRVKINKVISTFLGREGTITNIRGMTFDIILDGEEWAKYFYLHEFELVNPPKWESGDTGKFAGIPFTVSRVSPGELAITLDGQPYANSFSLTFFNKHAVKDLPKYKVGDYVILFPQDGNDRKYAKGYISQIGRIHSVIENGSFKGYYEVQFGNGLFQTVTPEDLKPSA